MISASVRPVASALVSAVLVAVCSLNAMAAGGQRQAQEPRVEPKLERRLVETRQPVERQIDPGRDAGRTREEFRQLLSRYPPTLARVLRYDPSLMSNDSYLTTYPEVAAYLSQHPEILHNPAYFVGVGEYEPQDSRSQAINMWWNMMEGVFIFGIFVMVTITFAWLIKTLIDYRRWHRVSKVQTEVHTKLLDRMASNEDLLAYIQTPAGRRFLESAPIPLEGPRAIAAPLGRILWSVQVGTVLGVAGIGLQFVSGRVLEEMTQPLFVIGVLAMSLGIGFILSAVVAFMLSRRLGLFEPPAPPVTEPRP